MPLAPRLSSLFPAAVRAAGEGLVDAIYVASTSRPDHVVAFVRGEPAARVEIRRRGQRLQWQCRCSAATAPLGRCGHAWAVLRYLDESEPEIAAHLETHTGSHLGELAGSTASATAVATTRDVAVPTDSASTAFVVPEDSEWDGVLARLSALVPREGQEREHGGSELVYVFVHPEASLAEDGLEVRLGLRKPTKKGARGAVRVVSLARRDLGELARGTELALLDALLGRGLGWSSASAGWYRDHAEMRLFQLRSAHDRELVRAMIATGRAVLQNGDHDEPLCWSDDTCELRLVLTRGDGKARLEGHSWCGGVRAADGSWIATTAGVALHGATFHPLAEPGATRRVQALLRGGSLEVPSHRAPELVARLLALPGCPPLDVPDDLRFRDVPRAPRPELAFSGPSGTATVAELGFWYEDLRIGSGEDAVAVVDVERRLRCLRDAEAEASFHERLRELGGRQERAVASWSFAQGRFAGLVRTLLAEGWRILADKRALVAPSAVAVRVSSGIDWFDVRGTCTFGDVAISVLRLFEKKARETGFVELGDGRVGVVPEAWLAKHAALAALSEVDAERDTLRVPRNRATLLDALLAERVQVEGDRGYEEWRQRLAGFQRITPREPPAGFLGELRPYQKEALGWFGFLREVGFSGCLADDMGLGKTVQVLALLEERRASAQGDARRTCLVVAPRSLVFHWQREARRFAPGLRVLEFTGDSRTRAGDRLLHHDLVITTYGTLRRDVEELAKLTFDYVILDEAQAIKNAQSQAAKAARLLRAEHRLALSGTPIENHVGELQSLFEFLNPGLLSVAPAVSAALRSVSTDPEARAHLARATRPFLLRRTKQEVARDLPERIEETLWCELGEEQRRFYEDVKETVRTQVLGVEAVRGPKGLAAVVTGLLRLRQVACHPGLFDAKRRGAESAKLEILLERLEELRAEGHKVLVFSQFTSLLALVRERLDAQEFRYEYLDGQTTDRAGPVERFQRDATVHLFLISLKAGGLGLNLTAASYVFLLDPWWNPAVEAQAIDRAHRIGQTQRVIAYRVIARDTIEERILELQARKRALADAILGAESGPLSDLTREDLEALFE